MLDDELNTMIRELQTSGNINAIISQDSLEQYKNMPLLGNREIQNPNLAFQQSQNGILYLALWSTLEGYVRSPTFNELIDTRILALLLLEPFSPEDITVTTQMVYEKLSKKNETTAPSTSSTLETKDISMSCAPSTTTLAADPDSLFAAVFDTQQTQEEEAK